MNIEVQFFGQLADKTGKSSIQLEHTSNLSHLKEKLFTLFPLLKDSKFVIAINKKGIDMFYLSILSILGILFVFVGFYSLHKELEYNYNILLFNPTLLGLVYFYFTKNNKWVYNLALVNLSCLAIYLIVLINKAHLLIVLPIVITSLIVLVKLVLVNKRIQKNH